MAVNSNASSTSPRGSGALGGISTAWLRLQSWRLNDKGTAARTSLRLRKEMGAEGAAIKTGAIGGYVELRGTVASPDAFNRAAEIARTTRGSRGVLNFLKVS